MIKLLKLLLPKQRKMKIKLEDSLGDEVEKENRPKVKEEYVTLLKQEIT